VEHCREIFICAQTRAALPILYLASFFDSGRSPHLNARASIRVLGTGNKIASGSLDVAADFEANRPTERDGERL